jgi:hypothetical protein
MAALGNEAGQSQTAQAHAAHKSAEQQTERNGGGADDKLEQLEPDDLVNQGGATAAEKQEQKQRQEAGRGGRRRRGVGLGWNHQQLGGLKKFRRAEGRGASARRMNFQMDNYFAP